MFLIPRGGIPHSHRRGNLESYKDKNKAFEEWRLLGCYSVWVLKEPTFRRTVEPPLSVSVASYG
jgi:hypothetical protein